MGSRSLIAVALVVGQVGCSLAFVKGRPDTLTLEAPPDCTTSQALPITEGILGIGGLAASLFLGLFAIAKEGDTGPGETNYYGYATLFTFLGATALVSDGALAQYKIRGCRAAHEDWRAMRNAPMVPPPGYPPGYPPGPAVGPPPGFERGTCRVPPASPCEAGLACASGYCVRPPMQ